LIFEYSLAPLGIEKVGFLLAGTLPKADPDPDPECQPRFGDGLRKAEF